MVKIFKSKLVIIVLAVVILMSITTEGFTANNISLLRNDNKVLANSTNSLDPNDPRSVEIFRSAFKGYIRGKKTMMENDPKAFLEMQRKSGINPFFAAAVSIVETGGGVAASKRMRRLNNYFSVGRIHYKSQYDSIIGFGNFMKTSKYYLPRKKDTVYKVSRTYCPSNAGLWNYRVTREMNHAFEKANAEIQRINNIQ